MGICLLVWPRAYQAGWGMRPPEKAGARKGRREGGREGGRAGKREASWLRRGSRCGGGAACFRWGRDGAMWSRREGGREKRGKERGKKDEACTVDVRKLEAVLFYVHFRGGLIIFIHSCMDYFDHLFLVVGRQWGRGSRRPHRLLDFALLVPSSW